MAGVSCTSNLASSDSLSAVFEETDNELTDRVGGWSVFLTFELLDRFKLIGEYLGALNDFAAGALLLPGGVG